MLVCGLSCFAGGLGLGMDGCEDDGGFSGDDGSGEIRTDDLGDYEQPVVVPDARVMVCSSGSKSADCRR